MTAGSSTSATGHRSGGFTLVELLTVIAIIALLVALVFPAVQAAREAARRVQCGTNIRQVALAIESYSTTMGHLPLSVANKVVNNGTGIYSPTRNPGPYLGGTPDTWAAEIMPRMELAALHDAFNFTKKVGDPVNRALALTPLPGLICPSDPQASTPILGNRCNQLGNPTDGIGHGQWYGGSIGPMAVRSRRCSFCPTAAQGPANACCLGSSGADLGQDGSPAAGFFGNFPTRVRFEDCLDGLSTTVLIGETTPRDTLHNGLYMSNFMTVVLSIPVNTFALPAEIPPDGFSCTGGAVAGEQRANGVKSRHPGGALAAMADGSVRLLRETMPNEVLWALGTKRGAADNADLTLSLD